MSTNSPRFTAVVRKKASHRLPILDTAGKPTGKDEEIKTETLDNPATDEAGNPIEAGTAEALLRAIRDYYSDKPHMEVLTVYVQETKIVQAVTGEELKKA